jgi:polysaccharide export outer membrane protein
MTPRFKFFLLLTSIFLVFTSCVSTKKLTYLQYSGMPYNSSVPVGDPKLSVTPAAYKIMNYDILYVRVITPDPQWSALFNTSTEAGGVITEETATLTGYPVDGDGNIEIPFVGKVQVAGITLSELKVKLDSVFKYYVNDAAITVRLVNNFISIIGEVRSPGRYPISKDLLNIFEALSMAGDMTEFSKRQKVQLIRSSPYGPIIKEFSLSDRSILTSEFYYIMPNDIVYVIPEKGRAFSVNSAVWALFLTTITSTLVVIGFFRTL